MASSWSDARPRTITPPRYILHSNEGSRARAQAPQRRCADLVRVSETIAAGSARTTDDAVLELQRESESQHLARIGVTGLLAAGFAVVALGALLLPGQRRCRLPRSRQPRSLRDRLPRRGRVSRLRRAAHGGRCSWRCGSCCPLRRFPSSSALGDAARNELPDVVRHRLRRRPARADGRQLLVLGRACPRPLRRRNARSAAGATSPIYAAALVAQFVLDSVSTFVLARARRATVTAQPRPEHALGLRASTLFSLRSASWPRSRPSRHPEALLLLLPMVLVVSRVATERQEKTTTCSS